MKTVGGAFVQELSNENTNLCLIWVLTLKNGVVYRFTDLDQNIVYSGNTYFSEPGIRVSAIETKTGGGVQNANIDVALSPDFISMETVRRGGLDNAEFTVDMLNYKFSNYGVMPIFRGRIGDIDITDRSRCTAQAVGLLGQARKSLTEIYTPMCRADLGDERCKVNLALFRASFTVTAATANGMSFTATSLNQPDDYWNLGIVAWTGGPNINQKNEIRDFELGGIVRFNLPLPYQILVGDTGTIEPGCDKQRSTCINRYANILNFRGEPDVPGQDAITYKVA